MRFHNSSFGMRRGVAHRSGSLVYVVLSALIVVIPWHLHSLDQAAMDDPISGEEFEVVRMVLEESWVGAGFAGLAAAVSLLTDPPTQDALRRMMEEQGCTDLHYGLRVSCYLSGGRVSVMTYHRRPYEDLSVANTDEFLDVLKRGPESTPRILFDASLPTQSMVAEEAAPPISP
ncbi:hypothetical protein [Paludisphaera rhizosphaerae]|uniref:hypothetical protein n=1 Tax=Paludisphaera rhizosphaerae TaxID=2711216 RepID=UPI0013EE0D2C|nr:hypothetical protein [Paludisphaera rhizosphaerae]